MTQHEHEFQGQKLRHDHPGGQYGHGYFEHPEDGFPYPAGDTSPLAGALARVDGAQALTGPRAESVELAALRNLADAVRAHLGVTP